VVNDAEGPLQSYNVSLVDETQPAGTRYFDVWKGVEITPHNSGQHGKQLYVEAQHDEYGAVAAVGPALAASSSFQTLMARMSELSKHAIASFSAQPHLSANFSFSNYSNALPAQCVNSCLKASLCMLPCVQRTAAYVCA
jgi:hypothetical protein